MQYGQYEMTIGADPEIFVEDSTGPVMACNRFGGAKKSPVFLSGDGGYLEDGCAVEFNVSPSDSLRICKDKLLNLIQQFFVKFPGYGVVYGTTIGLPRKTLVSEPKAMTIGCDADLWAWGFRDIPSISQFKGKRFAGGHIHIGINPWPEGLQKKTLIRYLDLMWLMPHLLYADNFRYPFYGYPGLYRETSYGVEYRSPDNFWLVGPSHHTIQMIQLFDRHMKNFMGHLNAEGIVDNVKRFERKIKAFCCDYKLDTLFQEKPFVKRTKAWPNHNMEQYRDRLIRDYL
jgi:Phage phiEco32-like COOH.NH2 ligase-type 2